jgi:uncharacterized protein YndB with AHSA1/START domain
MPETLEGLEIRRVLKARPERVFAAWTTPTLMSRWFFPDAKWSAEIASDLRPGGRWAVDMHEPAGRVHRQFGEYREVVPVSRLVFTWSCPDLGVVDSIVTVELTAHASGGTALTLSHELPPDPKIRAEHEGGWNGCLGNLATLVEGEQ